jgi:3-isopropylmalate/(R)-2-methylmalate dehydratase small subunit
VDYKQGIITNYTKGETYACNKMPEHIVKIMECGGLIPYLMEEK